MSIYGTLHVTRNFYEKKKFYDWRFLWKKKIKDYLYDTRFLRHSIRLNPILRSLTFERSTCYLLIATRVHKRRRDLFLFLHNFEPAKRVYVHTVTVGTESVWHITCKLSIQSIKLHSLYGARAQLCSRYIYIYNQWSIYI